LLSTEQKIRGVVSDGIHFFVGLGRKKNENPCFPPFC
jgi:hypothetical protein